jgi:hypothetical protein
VYTVKPGTTTNTTTNVAVEHNTYTALLQQSHIELTALQQHSMKLRRSKSETFVPYNLKGIDHSVLEDPVLDVKARFDNEIRSLRERFDAEVNAFKKDRDKQAKRYAEDMKRAEEGSQRLEDEKLKVRSSSVYQLTIS